MGVNKRDLPRAPCPSSCLLGRVNQQARWRMYPRDTSHVTRRVLPHSYTWPHRDRTHAPHRTVKRTRPRVRDRPPRAQSHKSPTCRSRNHRLPVQPPTERRRRDWLLSKTALNSDVARSVGGVSRYRCARIVCACVSLANENCAKFERRMSINEILLKTNSFTKSLLDCQYLTN